MSMFRYSGNGSMRYNAKELAFIAIQPAKFFTKEGPLYMRTSQGSHVWTRKKDVYNERWCRLRGNLLFYFKGRDLLSEPQGVIVLEQCFVKEEYAEIQSFAFCIEFVGEEHNQYFAAHSAELRDEWVAILQKGSYESLRSQFHSLRAQLLARTGQDPIDEERHGVVGKSDPAESSSREPVLEMSISCTELPKNNHGVSPSTFVSISCVTPPDTRWSKSGQTEIIDQNSNPFFLTTIAFETSRNISPITRLRANIYEVQDRNIHKVVPIGQVICSFRDIVTSPENRLVLDVIGTDGSKSGATITLLLWELEQSDISRPTSAIKPENPLKQMLGPPPQATPRRTRSMSLSRDNYFRALYCSPCTKTYRYPDVDGTHVLVQEIMVESKLSFSIPQQMIKLFLREERKKLEELNMFGELSRDWEDVRSSIMAEHVHLTVRYNESLEHLSKRTRGPQFKRSVDKAERLLEFVPINLHLQRLRVEQPGHREKMYDVVTVGAPAGHSMKFKHGGLKRLMQQYSDEQNRSVGLALVKCAIGSIGQSPIPAEQLAKIGTEAKLDWSTSNLMMAAKHFTIDTMKSKAHDLAEKVCEIVVVCEAPFMENMYNQYRIAQTNGKPPRKGTAKSMKNQSHQPHQSDPDGECSHSSGSSNISAGGGGRGANHRKSTHSSPSSNHVELRGKDYEAWEWNGAIEDFVRSTSSNSEGSSGGQANGCASSSATTWHGICHKLHANMESIMQAIELLPDSASVKERESAIDSGVKNLKESVRHLEDQARYSVGFYRMQEENKNLTLLQTLQCGEMLSYHEAISALIAGVITKVRSNIHNVGFLNQACRIGILVDFESLLSTYGDEMGMIEDMSVGIKDLEFVSFKFAQNRNIDADLIPVIGGTRSNIIVTVPLPQTLYNELPMEFHKGGGGPTISVHPIMFSVGMNEEQSLAELFGDTSLQDVINRESLQKLEIYYEQFIRNVPAEARLPTESSLALDVLMSGLQHHVAAKKNKNMDILHVSAQLIRRMNGVRVTSCKSAKDRTAMSVTLEQCKILQDEHQMPSQMFAHLLDTMRSEGTRRDNTRKNVGVNKYAFNNLQIRAFPKQYRPPEGTYGKTVVT
ncbi:LOW QUALITY PROTEIN: inositol polyphosphate-4-phosphatase type I A-like [Amphiura filiformis]|uniref:LOW QUALITY PROTEIN: inositol polyphosphate-4-phosphatase type I A-like n=1 Tax=Amphiura filiformis TaxID=82378 RepID=UPI003B20CDD6